MPSQVTAVPAAPAAEAQAHFAAEFGFETDCWDVHDAFARGVVDFVLLDVRSAELYARGHVPGALHLPHGKLVESKLACGQGNLRRTHRDFADVVELIASNRLDRSFARFLHKSVRATYRELVERSRGEE